MLFRKNKDNILREELLYQLKGLLTIELNPYLMNHDALDLFIETISGIDIYIYDKEFSYINQYHMINFVPPNFMYKGSYIDDISLVGHYHSDELLYLLMNFDKEKEEIIKNINKYIEWKEKYSSDKGERKKKDV